MMRLPPTLDIDAVRAFTLVAELQSFTRAAQATATTQSAVSLKLKRLEGRLSARLVERTPRSVRLTAAGARFLARARQLPPPRGPSAPRPRWRGRRCAARRTAAHNRHQRPRRGPRPREPDHARERLRSSAAARRAHRFLPCAV